jgi:hypothetical protein
MVGRKRRDVALDPVEVTLLCVAREMPAPDYLVHKRKKLLGFSGFREASGCLPHLSPGIYNVTYEQPIPHKGAEKRSVRSESA